MCHDTPDLAPEDPSVFIFIFKVSSNSSSQNPNTTTATSIHHRLNFQARQQLIPVTHRRKNIMRQPRAAMQPRGAPSMVLVMRQQRDGRRQLVIIRRQRVLHVNRRRRPAGNGLLQQGNLNLQHQRARRLVDLRALLAQERRRVHRMAVRQRLFHRKLDIELARLNKELRRVKQHRDLLLKLLSLIRMRQKQSPTNLICKELQPLRYELVTSESSPVASDSVPQQSELNENATANNGLHVLADAAATISQWEIDNFRTGASTPRNEHEADASFEIILARPSSPSLSNEVASVPDIDKAAGGEENEDDSFF